MKELLQKVLEFIQRRFRLLLALAILCLTVAIVFVDPPKVLSGAEDYIEQGNLNFDNNNYEEALDNFRSAKYFNPESFEVNYKIAASLMKIPPRDKNGFLIRYYMTEASNTADETAQLQLLVEAWESDPDLEKRFENHGMREGVVAEEVGRLKDQIVALKKIERFQCKDYNACIEIAETALGNENYTQAEKYYVKAIQEDESPESLANFDHAMAQIIMIQLKNGAKCGEFSWQKAIQIRKNGVLTDTPLKTELKRYERLKGPNCVENAVKMSNRFLRPEEGESLPAEELILRVKYIQATANLLLSEKPRSNGLQKTDENNDEKVKTSLEALNEPPADENDVAFAQLYEMAGKKIMSWGNDYKDDARKFFKISRSIYKSLNNAPQGQKGPYDKKIQEITTKLSTLQ